MSSIQNKKRGHDKDLEDLTNLVKRIDTKKETDVAAIKDMQTFKTLLEPYIDIVREAGRIERRCFQSLFKILSQIQQNIIESEITVDQEGKPLPSIETIPSKIAEEKDKGNLYLLKKTIEKLFPISGIGFSTTPFNKKADVVFSKIYPKSLEETDDISLYVEFFEAVYGFILAMERFGAMYTDMLLKIPERYQDLFQYEFQVSWLNSNKLIEHLLVMSICFIWMRNIKTVSIVDVLLYHCQLRNTSKINFILKTFEINNKLVSVDGNTYLNFKGHQDFPFFDPKIYFDWFYEETEEIPGCKIALQPEKTPNICLTVIAELFEVFVRLAEDVENDKHRKLRTYVVVDEYYLSMFIEDATFNVLALQILFAEAIETEEEKLEFHQIQLAEFGKGIPLSTCTKCGKHF